MIQKIVLGPALRIGISALVGLVAYDLSLSQGMSNLIGKFRNKDVSAIAVPTLEVRREPAPLVDEVDRAALANLGRITITNNGREDVRITSISITVEKTAPHGVWIGVVDR